MASWEPDIDPFDHGEIGEEDDRWDDTFTHNLETRLNKLRQFNKTLETSPNTIEGDILIERKKLKKIL